ncbi:MAG: F0F1 ATP synthase subunit A [Planctomycetota bacterium]
MFESLATLGAADPVAHVINHYTLKIGEFWVWSSAQSNLVLTGIILVFGMKWVAKNVSTGPEADGNARFVTRNPFAHFIEVVCVYLRDEVAAPLLHDRTRQMMPFLWTIFFFILVNNLLGLVPLLDLQHSALRGLMLAGGIDPYEPKLSLIGGTATQSIWVTAVLAIVAGIFFNIAAIQRLGVGGYFAHMTGGAPIFVAPLIFLLEFLGQIVIKPAALAIRLFANMTAGHILLATVFGFTGLVVGTNALLFTSVGLISLVAGIAIMFLEIFVAVLQAFVFMFLTTVFISLMDHHGDHGHEESHADDSSHGAGSSGVAAAA